MKTAAYAVAIGVAITFLCQVTLVENYRVVLKLNKTQTNEERVTYTCSIEPPSVKITSVGFLYSAYDPNVENDMTTGAGVHRLGNDLSFHFAQINGTNADKRYFCMMTIRDDDSEFPRTTLSNPIDFKLERFMKPIFGVDIPREEVKVSLNLTEGYRLDEIREHDDISFDCCTDPSFARVLKWTWFFNEMELNHHYGQNIYLAKNGRRLVMKDVGKSRIGKYVCEITVEEGFPIQSNEQIIKNIHPMETKPHEYDDSIINVNVANIRYDRVRRLGMIRQFDNVLLTCNFNSSSRQLHTRTWYHNGRPIYDNVFNNGSELELYDIRTKTEGRYICVVETDEDKSYASPPTEIDVKNGNYFLTNGPVYAQIMGGKLGLLYFAYVKEHSNLYFTCEVKLPPTTYYNHHEKENKYRVTWFYNDLKLRQSSKVHFLNYNLTMVLPSVRENSSGVYNCRIEMTNGTVIQSNNLRIKVWYHPPTPKVNTIVITDMQNFPGSINEGDDVEIKCRIYPDTIKKRDIIWYHDDFELKTDHRILYDNRSLWILNVTEADIGSYFCQVGNGSDALMSSELELQRVRKEVPKKLDLDDLKAEISPKVYAKLGNQSQENDAHLGDVAYFTCIVEPSQSIKRLSWYHNDVQIEPNRSFYYLFGNYSLVIQRVELNSSGNYYCKVDTKLYAREVFSNPVPMRLRFDTKPTSDSVRYFLVPELRQHPDKIYEDSDVTFFCNIFPVPEMGIKISWFRNGTKIDDSTRRTLVVGRGETLKIFQVKPTEVWNYTCQMTTKENITYTSPPAPQFKIKPKEEKRQHPNIRHLHWFHTNTKQIEFYKS